VLEEEEDDDDDVEFDVSLSLTSDWSSDGLRSLEVFWGKLV
jgi:hypothetical protein